MENLISKKFIVILFIILCATILTSVEKLTPEWVALIVAVAGGYMGVNVYSKKIEPQQIENTKLPESK